MPKIRTLKSKKPPQGFEDIEETLLDFELRLKDAETRSKAAAGGGPATPLGQALWPVYRLHHQRTRYIYDLYYTRRAVTNSAEGISDNDNDNDDDDDNDNSSGKTGAISAELYAWLVKNRYADAQLIAKWKKQGYERLCCLRCIQARENVHGGTCICRVPKAQLAARAQKEEENGDDDGTGKKKKKGAVTVKSIECVTCGCRGCASTD